MVRWLRRLRDSLVVPADQVAGWTPARAQQAERQTLTAQGYVVEPHYTWSLKFRSRKQLRRVVTMNRKVG